MYVDVHDARNGLEGCKGKGGARKGESLCRYFEYVDPTIANWRKKRSITNIRPKHRDD